MTKEAKMVKSHVIEDNVRKQLAISHCGTLEKFNKMVVILTAIVFQNHFQILKLL